MQEIQRICAHVVERNAYKSSVHARRQAFDAWRQAVEVLLVACPPGGDLLGSEERQGLLFELLQDLLDKVRAGSPNSFKFLLIFYNLCIFLFFKQNSSILHFRGFIKIGCKRLGGKHL